MIARSGGPAPAVRVAAVPPRPQRSTLARYRRLAIALAVSDAVCL
jgi:hypothetical protein